MAEPAQIVWRQAALDDLLAIVDYIADRNPPAAQVLADAIRRRVGQLPENPLSGRPGRVDGTREMVVRPNYIVVYGPMPGRIEVLRVLHARRMWP